MLDQFQDDGLQAVTLGVRVVSLVGFALQVGEPVIVDVDLHRRAIAYRGFEVTLPSSPKNTRVRFLSKISRGAGGAE